MNMNARKPMMVGLVAFFALVLGATAGSLTPSALPVATMYSLSNLYDAIASATFDSSAIVANQNGSLMGVLKYIENQTAWASGSNDIWALNSGNVGIGDSSPETKLEVVGTASISQVYIGPSSASYSMGATQLNVSLKMPTSAIGSVSAGVTAFDVEVHGNYAYTVNQNGDALLRIIDISNPESPALVGSVSVGGGPSEVSVRGKYAYVVNYTGGSLKAFDISNPASPSLASTVGVGGLPKGVYVQGSYAYVVGESGSLQVVDISNPRALTSVKAISLGAAGTKHGVYAQDGYLYVILNNASGRMKIYDISNPASPRMMSSVSAGVNPQAIVVQGRYAYVVNHGRTLQIFDIANPEAPIEVSSTSLGGSSNSNQAIHVQGRYAYIANNASDLLEIYDVSNPASPLIVGSVAPAADPSDVFVQGRYAYVTSQTGALLQIFDLGGAYVQQLEAGGIYAGTLALRNNLSVFNDANIGGGLSIGRGFQASDFSSINIASLSSNISSISNQSLLRLSNAVGYISGNVLSLDMSTGTTQEYFTGNFAKFSLSGTPRFIIESSGAVLASGSAQFGSAGSPSSTSYSRFGIDTAFNTNWISAPSDLMLSSDLEVHGSAQFSSFLRVSSGSTNALFADAVAERVGIGTTAPEFSLHVVKDVAQYSYFNGEATYGFVSRKARGTQAAPTTVQVGDHTGFFLGQGYDGNSFENIGHIQFEVDTTPSDGVIPGRIVFETSNAAGAITERMRLDSFGNLGIGTTTPTTKLDIIGNASVSAILEVGGNTLLRSSASISAHLELVGNASIGGNVVIAGNCSDAPGGGGCTADYAEVYVRDPSDPMSAGDLLSLNPATGKVTKASHTNSNLIGVFTSAPGALIGQRSNSIQLGIGTNVMSALDSDEVPVALIGRVPVRVSLENGPISIGDRLSVSSTPGIAAKATSAGMTAGIAMEPLTSISSGSSQEILMYVNTSYWAPSVDALTIIASSSAPASSNQGILATIIDALRSMILTVQELVAGTVQTNRICVGSACVTEEQFLRMIEASGGAPATPTPTPEVITADGGTPQDAVAPTPSASPEATEEPVTSPEVTPSPSATPEVVATPEPTLEPTLEPSEAPMP